LGTLQVDSDLALSEMGFALPGAAPKLQAFADVVALQLKGS
jgi:hypothetical protein